MNTEIVKLKLDLASFDETPHVSTLDRCLAHGIVFETMESLGDTQEHRTALYDLNKTISEDIPGRGEFFTFDEFTEFRFDFHYDPTGVQLALIDSVWVGLSAFTNWSEKGFVFYEMTGVLHEHRRKGIATAMKVLGLRYAKRLGVAAVYATHGIDNMPAISMNRDLGFVDAEWD